MIPIVYDCPDENGMQISVFMDDEQAENLITIIQNKLNARLKI